MFPFLSDKSEGVSVRLFFAAFFVAKCFAEIKWKLKALTKHKNLLNNNLVNAAIYRTHSWRLMAFKKSTCLTSINECI